MHTGTHAKNHYVPSYMSPTISRCLASHTCLFRRRPSRHTHMHNTMYHHTCLQQYSADLRTLHACSAAVHPRRSRWIRPQLAHLQYVKLCLHFVCLSVCLPRLSVCPRRLHALLLHYFSYAYATAPTQRYSLGALPCPHVYLCPALVYALHH